MGSIRVGTSSWADRSLIASGWYPREVNTPAGRLAHYATFFDLVEVDTTFHAIPAVETTAAWADRTPAGFTFDITAFGLFTGHPTPVGLLPRDLRPAGADGMIRWRDLPAESYAELWARFRAAVEPVADAGKLGAILLRFPPWLRRSDAAQRRITDLAQRCRPGRVAVDLRHPSWFTAADILATMRFLYDLDTSLVCVDAEPPVLVGTAEPAVVRFDGEAPGRTRLGPWVPRLRELAGHVDEVHVLMNTCCGDQAQRDAARLIDLLRGSADHGDARPA